MTTLAVVLGVIIILKMIPHSAVDFILGVCFPFERRYYPCSSSKAHAFHSQSRSARVDLLDCRVGPDSRNERSLFVDRGLDRAHSSAAEKPKDQINGVTRMRGISLSTLRPRKGSSA